MLRPERFMSFVEGIEISCLSFEKPHDDDREETDDSHGDYQEDYILSNFRELIPRWHSYPP